MFISVQKGKSSAMQGFGSTGTIYVLDDLLIISVSHATFTHRNLPVMINMKFHHDFTFIFQWDLSLIYKQHAH